MMDEQRICVIRGGGREGVTTGSRNLHFHVLSTCNRAIPSKITARLDSATRNKVSVVQVPRVSTLWEMNGQLVGEGQE